MSLLPSSGDCLPSERGQMPESLILPLEDAVRQFRAALLFTHEHEYSVEDFLDEILRVVRARFIDVEAFDEFLQETATHYPSDCEVLVPALERLGKTLQRELYLCGAYTSDGLLHYCFGGWLTPNVPWFLLQLS